MTQRSYRSIGDVLTLLRAEFPDITISKIRFLESQGLVSPQRSPSGYRKFYDEDVERLRYVLRQQREHFLPLKVIRDRLNGDAATTDPSATDAAIDAPSHTGSSSTDSGGAKVEIDDSPDEALIGSSTAHVVKEAQRQPSTPEGSTPTEEQVMDEHEHRREPEVSAPSVSDMVAALQEGPVAARAARPSVVIEPAPVAVEEEVVVMETETLTYDELLRQTGLDESTLASLIEFGLVKAITIGGMTCFEPSEATIASLAARYGAHGVEPRHLRQFRNAAEREAGLLEQLVAPMLRQRNPEARQRAEALADDLAQLGADLRAALVAREINVLLGR